jgi:EmrB/QacA subfamily drug resistance transporter
VTPDGLPRWRVMPALALGTLMATLDISAVNIALPTLSRTFALPLTTVEWVVIAYVLTITGTLLAFGRLADRVGRRRVYAIGLAIFGAASLLCALAPSIPLLIAARALQGLGAAMMTANSAAILISSFPAAERGRALGVFGAVVGVGLALGPPIGGVLVGHLSWRWIFLVNVPLAAIAQGLVRSRVPADPPPSARAPLELPAAALWCGALVLLMLGLSRAPTHGAGDSMAWAGVIGGLLLLVVFLGIERSSRDPLLPLPIMIGPVGYAACLTLIGQAISIAIGIHMPLYLEDVLGFDAARSGRWMAVLPLTALLLAPAAGRWADAIGSRPVAMLGMSIATIGLIVLSSLGASPGTAHLIGGMALIGGGLGLFTVPNASSLLSAAPGSRLGIVSGLQATMRNLGITVGTAATAAIVASRAARAGSLASHAHRIDRDALVLATRDVYVSFAVVAAVGVVMIALQRRAGTARAE